MRSTIGKIATTTAAAMMISGCATVLRGTKQEYAIESTPPGATVSTTTGIECITPCELKLKRKNGFAATFTLLGYETQTVEVDSLFTGGAALAGNAILGGLIGAAVDATNGSLNSLSPDPLIVNLVPLDTTPSAADVPVRNSEDVPVAPDAASDTVPETVPPSTDG